MVPRRRTAAQPMTHEGRRKRWLAATSPATQSLAAAVDRLLVPIIREAGFDDPALVAVDESLHVSGRTIDLWRATGPDDFQFIQLDFDKYRAPRLQVRFGELKRRGGRWASLRSGSLVPRGKRYFHEWGKPRWCPLRLWSERDSECIVGRLKPMIGQILCYFETGERDRNLGEVIDHSALVAAVQEPQSAA